MSPDPGETSPPTDHPGDEGDPPFERVAETVFPPEYQEIGLAKIRALATAIASIRDPNHRTPWPIQKFCMEIYYDGAVIFSPYSVDLEGPVSVDVRNCLDGMEQEGILARGPSEVTNGAVDRYDISPRYADAILPSGEWERKAESFFKTISTRRPFMEVNPSDPRTNDFKYDKARYYPKVLNQEAHIGLDGPAVQSILDGSFYVDVDPDIVEVLHKTPPRRIRDAFDDRYWPVAHLEYHLLNAWKHLYMGGGGSESTDRYEQAARKFRVRDLARQTHRSPNRVHGDACFLWGYLDLWSERLQNAGPNEYLLKEGLTVDESVRLRFDGELEIPEQDLYDYNIGVAGVVDVDGGRPVVRVLSMLRFRRLPSQVLDVQDRNRVKLHVEQYNDDREELLSVLEAIEAHEDVEGDLKESVGDYKEKVKKGLQEIHGINLIVELVQKYPELESVVIEILRNPPM